jgi:hypothetical protein
MGRPLQIREVPDDVLAALKERAAVQHLSLAAYALRILEREAHMAAVAEALNRPGTRGKVTRREIVALLREDREGH